MVTFLNKFITAVTNYIIGLKDKEFQRFTAIFIFCMTVGTAAFTFYTYRSSNKHIENMRQLYRLADNTTTVLLNNEQIQGEENRIQELLQQNENFSIKSYFEQFCREHRINPEANWETTVNPIEGNNKFEEVVLTALFKNATTKALATILDSLDKNAIVYLKELRIKKEEKHINFELVIATKKVRHVVEE